MELEAVVEVAVSLLAWLSVLEKCSLVSVLETSGPSTARPVVTELGLYLPPGRAEDISLQVVRIIVRIIVRLIVRIIVRIIVRVIVKVIVRSL